MRSSDSNRTLDGSDEGVWNDAARRVPPPAQAANFWGASVRSSAHLSRPRCWPSLSAPPRRLGPHDVIARRPACNGRVWSGQTQAGWLLICSATYPARHSPRALSGQRRAPRGGHTNGVRSSNAFVLHRWRRTSTRAGNTHKFFLIIRIDIDNAPGLATALRRFRPQLFLPPHTDPPAQSPKIESRSALRLRPYLNLLHTTPSPPHTFPATPGCHGRGQVDC